MKVQRKPSGSLTGVEPINIRILVCSFSRLDRRFLSCAGFCFLLGSHYQNVCFVLFISCHQTYKPLLKLYGVNAGVTFFDEPASNLERGWDRGGRS